jgi:CO/xanthine dehydrogenase Mo-binding subunit
LSERRAAFDKSAAAAVANAVCNAPGVRVRDHPFALDKPIE